MDVKAAGRTIDVFELFARVKEPLSVSEISRALNAPLSSCVYLIRTLEKLGYLYTVGARKHIYPTRKLFLMATEIQSGEPWKERIEPWLVRLRDETQETVLLAKQQGHRVVYLTVYEGSQTIRYAAKTGDTRPLHASTAGKALLSAIPPAERAKIIGKLARDPVDGATIRDRDALLEQLDRIHERGFADSLDDNVAESRGMAKPVWLGRDLYAVAVAGPLERLSKEHNKVLAALDQACKGIAAS